MTSTNMMFRKDRLETFGKNWIPLKNFKYCTPENFAKAGFFNTSTMKQKNSVKCFSCRKELCGWEKQDDPWEEHKRRGQACVFVELMVKNPDGVFTIEELLRLYFDMKKNLVKETYQVQREVLQEEVDSYKSILKTMRRNRL